MCEYGVDWCRMVSPNLVQISVQGHYPELRNGTTFGRYMSVLFDKKIFEHNMSEWAPFNSQMQAKKNTNFRRKAWKKY